MTESFPAILSRLRRERRLNQRTAAAALGISQALLSHYENGLREPGLGFVDAACRYYGVSADYLLGRSPVRTALCGEDAAGPVLAELGEAAAQALEALLRGLRERGDDEAEAARDLVAVFFYSLLRPFDPARRYQVPEALWQPLSGAAIQLCWARLQSQREDGAEGLQVTLPPKLLALAEAELNVLRDEWR